ncbi:radical SAM protein [Candidatus Sumerlaeota bacterium]|nr:radical SAM protein [Candidatus Sumerlaeota bacterium]
MNPQKISKNRLTNRIKAALDSTYLSEYVLAYPSVYYFGVSIICDIHCPYCPRQFYTKDIDSGFMDYDAFLKTVPYLEYGEEAYFFGLGEPFLHPRFFDFISQSLQTGIKTGTSTHGMSLKPEARKKILDLGLDELIISIDSADPNTFDMLRKGAKLDVVTSNILDIQKEKKRRNVSKPNIVIATAVSRHNVRGLADIMKLAKKLQAIRVVFTDLILVNPENALVSVSRTDLFQKHYNKAKSLGKKYGIEVLYFYQYPFPWKKDPTPPRLSIKRRFCRDPWRMCILNRHGEMKPCCYYPPNTGNLFQNPLEEIINNEDNRFLRRSLLEGNIPDCCVNCGMLTEISPQQSLDSLIKAKNLIEEAKNHGDFSQKDIDDLSQLVSEYKKKFDEMYE